MSQVDSHGYASSGAAPTAVEAYERALAAFQSWHSGAEPPLAAALQEAPAFVMAHVLQAYLRLGSRDPRIVRSAQAVRARGAALPANEREGLHLAAIAAVLADDYERAKTILGQLLGRYPRDVLALQVAHAFDYLTGDTARLRDRVAGVLPAWSGSLPGYHAVLAMHAFGLEESGEFERAEEAARAALALNTGDARAHHVMAHVFEMTERPAAGVRWLDEHRDAWSTGTIVATHCWWHMGLFYLAQGHFDRALALYDERLRAGSLTAVADLIDATALLWRVQLLTGDAGARWSELASAWAPHIDDRFCSFSDMHAMLAFVGAQDWKRAQRLDGELAAAQLLPTRYGETTRQVGLPACRALLAFGRGDDARAIAQLACLPAWAHRLGGSHAQRDVLYFTLREAVVRLRRHVYPGHVRTHARSPFELGVAMS